MCNASDTAGRYSYGKQPEVLQVEPAEAAEEPWTRCLSRLAEAILAQEFDASSARATCRRCAGLGLVQAEQEGDGALVAQLLETMHLTGERAPACHGPWLSGSLSPVLWDCLCKAYVTSWLIRLGGPGVLPNGSGRPGALGKAAFTRVCCEPQARSHWLPP